MEGLPETQARNWVKGLTIDISKLRVALGDTKPKNLPEETYTTKIAELKRVVNQAEATVTAMSEATSVTAPELIRKAPILVTEI